MEVVQWLDEKGYTLTLTREEILELADLMDSVKYSYFYSFASAHFEVRLEE